MSAATYIAIYYYFLLALSIWLCLFNVKYSEDNRGVLSFILLFFVFAHIGFRPLDPLFGDTLTYARVFDDLTQSVSIDAEKDFFFYYLSWIISRFTHSTTVYFCLIAIGYILPVYYAFKKKVPYLYFLLLFVYVSSFSFWGYGVNGLRNGLGVSFFLLGLFSEKTLSKIICYFLAVAFHSSLILPVGAYIIVNYLCHNPRLFIVIWVACLVAALLFGESIGDLLGSFSFINGIDERMGGYLNSSLQEYDESLFSHRGFRWDFVLYSSLPIAVGAYYLFKKKYCDLFYISLYCIYLLCNSFWLLTVYVPYNNRFAYLSWFLHPILIIYPLLDNRIFFNNRDRIIHWVVLLNYLFTFIMWMK